MFITKKKSLIIFERIWRHIFSKKKYSKQLDRTFESEKTAANAPKNLGKKTNFPAWTG